MLRIILLLILPVFISCSRQQKDDEANVNPVAEKQAANEKTRVALEFINSYVNYCGNQQKKLELIDWINDNKLVTDSFKTALRKIIDDAKTEDPELGPDFDPIFDAQDYPLEGFVTEASNETEFLIVRGKDWPDFKLTVKVAQENGKWLVDGCGMVNVPEEYRVMR